MEGVLSCNPLPPGNSSSASYRYFSSACWLLRPSLLLRIFLLQFPGKFKILQNMLCVAYLPKREYGSNMISPFFGDYWDNH